MRMGSTWANPNAGNQNYLNALAAQQYIPQPVAPVVDQAPVVAPQSAVQPAAIAAPKAAPVAAVPQTRIKPVTPNAITRTPVTEPEVQIRPKVRQVTQSRSVGQNQATMAPGGNQSVFGDPALRAYKKGGIVTTRKVSTAVKNKSQSKW